MPPPRRCASGRAWRMSGPALTSPGCRSATASRNNSRNCAARSRPAILACRSGKAASSPCASSRRHNSRCWSASPRWRRRPCGGRCLIPTRITPTARRPLTGTCRRPMGGWSPSRCRKAAASRARCTSSRWIRGKKLADEIPRVQFPTGGGSAAWTADGSGIFYTRYPHPGRAAGGRPRFLPAGLVSPARHAGRRTTNTPSAGTSRALPRSSWRPARTANGSWPRWPTATAATSPITCAMPRATGGN